MGYPPLMYGMVNNAVQDMALAKFGTETWTRIHTLAKTDAEFEKMPRCAAQARR